MNPPHEEATGPQSVRSAREIAALGTDVKNIKDRQDRFEADIRRLETKMEAGFAEQRATLAPIAASVQRGKGALAALMGASGLVGGLIATASQSWFGK